MIGEAIDTLITLGWAVLAWIAVLSAVASIVLLAGTAVGMWAVRGAWRRLSRPHIPSPVSGDPETVSEPPRPRTADRVPSWAHTQPLDHEEAA